MWMRDAVASRKAADAQGPVVAALLPVSLGRRACGRISSSGSATTCRHGRCARSATSSAGSRRSPAQSLDDLTDGLARGAARALRPRANGRQPTPPLIAANRAGGGRLNLAASLSPDGRRMVFLSERDQFSIDLYLADAATGRVIRKLITTADERGVREPAIPAFGGRLGCRGLAVCPGDDQPRPPSLVILDVDRGTTAADVPVAAGGRGLQPDVVARRRCRSRSPR